MVASLLWIVEVEHLFLVLPLRTLRSSRESLLYPAMGGVVLRTLQDKLWKGREKKVQALAYARRVWEC